VIREYDRASIVKEAVPWRRSPIAEGGKFVQIGLRILVGPELFIDSYSTRGEGSYSPEIVGVGHSLGIGEEKYLIDRLRQNVKREIDAKSLTVETLSEAIATFPPSSQVTAFVPIDFYSTLHLALDKRMRIEYSNYRPTLIVGPRKMRVFWSNNYVPFKEVILVSREFGEWVVKPDKDTGDLLTFELRPVQNKPNFTDVTVKTIAVYSILAQKEGLVVRLPS